MLLDKNGWKKMSFLMCEYKPVYFFKIPTITYIAQQLKKM